MREQNAPGVRKLRLAPGSFAALVLLPIFAPRQGLRAIPLLSLSHPAKTLATAPVVPSPDPTGPWNLTRTRTGPLAHSVVSFLEARFRAAADHYRATGRSDMQSDLPSCPVRSPKRDDQRISPRCAALPRIV